MCTHKSLRVDELTWVSIFLHEDGVKVLHDLPAFKIPVHPRVPHTLALMVVVTRFVNRVQSLGVRERMNSLGKCFDGVELIESDADQFRGRVARKGRHYKLGALLPCWI